MEQSPIPGAVQSTPNLLVDDEGDLVGVLDWRLATIAPRVFDLANAVSGALMFSRLPVGQAIEATQAAYGSAGTYRCCLKQWLPTGFATIGYFAARR